LADVARPYNIGTVTPGRDRILAVTGRLSFPGQGLQLVWRIDSER